jgi:hypothetical protein
MLPEPHSLYDSIFNPSTSCVPSLAPTHLSLCTLCTLFSLPHLSCTLPRYHFTTLSPPLLPLDHPPKHHSLFLQTHPLITVCLSFTLLCPLIHLHMCVFYGLSLTCPITTLLRFSITESNPLVAYYYVCVFRWLILPSHTVLNQSRSPSLAPVALLPRLLCPSCMSALSTFNICVQPTFSFISSSLLYLLYIGSLTTSVK